MKPKKIYYFASTHWDREWYKTCDEFRFKLVPVLDEIIDTLEKDPSFTVFTLDGQTSVLDDYLEIRPENKDRLIKLISAKRLLVGPFYTMPDEFLVSAESIVRNLEKGHRIAKDFGADAFPYGYVCDIFGHVAALPRILNGFGIRGALLSRGLNDDFTPCHFRWVSPDGSSVTGFKAPEICGYGSFFAEVILPCLPNPEKRMDELFALACKYVERELTRTEFPYVVLMDGMDHEKIHPFAPELARRLQEKYGCPVVFENLADICKDLAELPLPEVKGEINQLGKNIVEHNKLITHTLSSRYDLKRQNDDCQLRMEKYALPVSAVSAARGLGFPFSYIDVAYKNLLLNHAHDSICGCSIDAVHREMSQRFEKCMCVIKEYEQLLHEQQYRRFQADETSGEVAVNVFNPLPQEYEGEITMPIDFPINFPARECRFLNYEQRNLFRIFDKDGNDVPYQIVRAERGAFVRNMDGNYNRQADRHIVSIHGKLQPFGYTVFYVRSSDKPCRIMDRISDGPLSCESDTLSVQFRSDGTFDVKDKETGRIYSNLHSFLDDAETGDGWFHIQPVDDACVSSRGAACTVEKAFDGAQKCVFRVKKYWNLPKEALTVRGFAHRSENTELLTIRSEITVYRTGKRIDISTTVQNTCKDHRLRLQLPTGIPTDTYTVSQCGDLISRPCGLYDQAFDWKEADVGERQFEDLVLKRGKDGTGLAFFSKGGLHEVYCPTDTDGDIFITLMRCFSTTFLTNGEKDGQLAGDIRFDYALRFLSEKDSDAAVFRDKEAYRAGYSCFTVPVQKGAVQEQAAPFFALQSDSVVYQTSAASRTVGGGILVRLANLSDKSARATLHFADAIESAAETDYLERETGKPSVKKNSLTLSFKPKEWKTVLVKLQA